MSRIVLSLRFAQLGVDWMRSIKRGTAVFIFMIMATGLTGCPGSGGESESAPAPASVTITWQAPTEKSDGSQLTDLAGFFVYYGPTPGNYSMKVSVAGANTRSYVARNLSPGTYYFAVTAYDSGMVESVHSNPVGARVQ